MAVCDATATPWANQDMEVRDVPDRSARHWAAARPKSDKKVAPDVLADPAIVERITGLCEFAGTSMRPAGFEPATRGLEVRRSIYENAGSAACSSQMSMAIVRFSDPRIHVACCRLRKPLETGSLDDVTRFRPPSRNYCRRLSASVKLALNGLLSYSAPLGARRISATAASASPSSHRATY